MPTMLSERPQSSCLRPRAWVLAAVAINLGGCATQMEIKPMATGQIDRPAYELTGGDLSALRREAQYLCNGGGDIVRQASAGQRPEAVDGRIQRWLNKTNALLDPPVQQAQLVVVCQPDRLPAVTALAPAPAAATAPVLRTRPMAAAPIGPLMPEW